MNDPVPDVATTPADLVDIHCHGALGVEFGADSDSSRAAAAHHRSSGTGTLVASLVSAPPQVLRAGVRALAPLVADGTLAGIHLEGPFLADACRGAHDPRFLIDPDPALVADLVAEAEAAGVPGAIKHLTFAPERPGAHELVRELLAHGIRPAVGHTAASPDVVARVIADIAERSGRPALVTHLFNGMPAFHHRAGGPAAAALAAAARGEAVVELIGDGAHLGSEVVRMVFDTVGPDHVALVSDAMSATGPGDGDYVLGGLPVRVTDGTARLVEGGSIAGGTSTVAQVVRWCVDVAGVTEVDALVAASRTPRRILDLPDPTASAGSPVGTAPTTAP